MGGIDAQTLRLWGLFVAAAAATGGNRHELLFGAVCLLGVGQRRVPIAGCTCFGCEALGLIYFVAQAAGLILNVLDLPYALPPGATGQCPRDS